MKMSWEIHEMLKTTSSNNAFGRTRLLIGLLASDTGNLDWKLWGFRSSLHRLCRWKHGGSFQSYQWRLMKYILEITGIFFLQEIYHWFLREDWNIWWASVKFVPWLPANEQKQCCMFAKNCWHQKRHTFFLWVITGDETCVYYHNQETKWQYFCWESPFDMQIKPVSSCRTWRRCWWYFFDCDCIHQKFVSPG